MTTSEHPIIGDSLLPEGISLPDYIQKVRGLTYQALEDFNVGAEEYIKIYIMSRCLNAIGWNTRIDNERASFSDGKNTHYGFEYALLLDDGTVVSIQGDLGWEAIHHRVENKAHNCLVGKNDFMRERFKASNPSNPSCPIIWSKCCNLDSVHEEGEVRFHRTPRSANVLGQIVSDLYKDQILQNTASASAPRARAARL